MLRSFVTGFCDLIYPPRCFICQKRLSSQCSSKFLCWFCHEAIQWNTPPFCLKCSRHLKNNFHRPQCRECTFKKPLFDFAWGACIFNGTLQKLIHQFKYGQKTYLSQFFSELMTAFIKTYNLDIEQFEMIMPIPLFSARFRERGYNQSRLLAESISRNFQIELSCHHLIKIRPTINQAISSQKERWTNIQGAFKIVNSAVLADKNILIIDDLLTTGATASEAAGVLKKAGAKTVGVLTLAITV